MGTNGRPVLLVVDDDPAMCRMLERFGERRGFHVVAHDNGNDTIASLASNHPDMALIDLKMPEVGGLDVLRAIRQARAECHVVLMTGHATVDTAIEAVKLGARDYVSKPLPFDRLEQLMEGVRDDIGRRRMLLEAEVDHSQRIELCGMIGCGEAMKDLFALIRSLAPYARAALITGETGTGKELAARALHHLGPRAHKPFVTINCAAVVDSLFESELFGHTRGAFTGATEQKAGLFEAADGGTLFLDEVGELSAGLQAKLLRVLETGEVQRLGALTSRTVDVRIIAATNRDLESEVAAGRFRRDLLYRLNVVEIVIPPLRHRLEDIPYLTAAFIGSCRERFQTSVAGVSAGTEVLLRSYNWPGNVRELRNVLERACLLSDGPLLSELDVARALPGATEPPAGIDPTGSDARTTRRRRHPAASEVEAALQQAGGNRSAAARRLGMSRRTLYRRLDAFALR